MFTQKYLVTLVIFLDLLTHMQKGEPGPSLAEVSPGGGGGVVEEEEDKVSCDWWRAGHVTTILTPDWLQDGISAVAERDGFIAVADTGGRVTFFSEDLQVNDGQIFLSVSNIFTCSG